MKIYFLMVTTRNKLSTLCGGEQVEGIMNRSETESVNQPTSDSIRVKGQGHRGNTRPLQTKFSRPVDMKKYMKKNQLQEYLHSTLM
jgi:hypothetical protein